MQCRAIGELWYRMRSRDEGLGQVVRRTMGDERPSSSSLLDPNTQAVEGSSSDHHTYMHIHTYT